MRPFTFSRAGRPWPPGLTLLHVYVVADLARDRELAALVDGCRGATGGEPLAHVGDAWLHITLCQVTVPAHEVGGDQRAALATRIGQRLAAVAPFTITVGDPLCVPTGVLLRITDGMERLAEVRRLVSRAAGMALGPAAISGNEGTLHMTESYARGAADDHAVALPLAEEGASQRRVVADSSGAQRVVQLVASDDLVGEGLPIFILEGDGRADR